MQSSYSLLLFIPQMPVDKHNGETLTNVQGNLLIFLKDSSLCNLIRRTKLINVCSMST